MNRYKQGDIVKYYNLIMHINRGYDRIYHVTEINEDYTFKCITFEKIQYVNDWIILDIFND